MHDIPDVLHYESNPESDRLLVYFGDAGSPKIVGIGFFAESKINKLFLRDPNRSWYNGPIEGLSQNADELADVIRQFVKPFAPENVLMSGGSMGGYASLLFGSLLGVGKIVAFAPQFRLHPKTPYSPKMPVKYTDLYDLVASRHARTNVEVWHGTEDIMDLYQNLPALSIEGVVHRPLKGYMHNILADMKRDERIGTFFRYITGDAPFETEMCDLSFVDRDAITRAVQAYYIDKDDDSAIAVLSPIAGLYNLSAVHHALGLCYYRKNDISSAESCFDAAINCCDRNYSAYYYKGITLMDRKDYAQAERYFVSTIERFPSPNALRYSQLGAAQRLQGKLDEAKAAHLHALSIDPEHVPSHFQLGLIYRDQGLVEEAIESFQRHHMLRPTSDASRKEIARLAKRRTKKILNSEQ